MDKTCVRGRRAASGGACVIPPPRGGRRNARRGAELRAASRGELKRVPESGRPEARLLRPGERGQDGRAVTEIAGDHLGPPAG